MEKSLKLDRMYIESAQNVGTLFSDERDSTFQKEYSLYSYQQKILTDQFNGADIIFLDAPTGSGKTFSFILPVIGTFEKDQGGILTKTVVITEPTNQILEEEESEISLILKKFFNDKIKVTKITGPGKEKKDQKGLAHGNYENIINATYHSKLILTNPDILTLLISYYYKNTIIENRFNQQFNASKLKDWKQFFASVDYIIFDEYHSYNEASLGKLVAYTILGKGSGLFKDFKHLKIIFSSGTPLATFKNIIKKNIDKSVKIYDSIKPEIFYGKDIDKSKAKVTQFRGETEIIFTDREIFEETDYRNNDGKRRMYLFNKVVEMEQFGEKLRRENISFISYSRIDTKIKDKQIDKNDSNVIISTATTMELGSNKNPDIAHVEVGYNVESILQRIGRVSRRGQAGKIYIHLGQQNGMLIDSIKNYTEPITYEQLTEEVEKLLNKKFLDVPSLNANIGAMLYFVYKGLSFDDPAKSDVEKIGKKFKFFEAMVRVEEFKENAIDILNKTQRGDQFEIENLKRWIVNIFNSFRLFRGNILEKDIEFKRGGIEVVRSSQNLIWIKRFTEYEYNRENHVYLIKKFSDEPNNIFCLTYPSLNNRKGLSIPYLELIDKSKFTNNIKRDFNEWYEWNFQNCENETLRKYLSDIQTVIENLSYLTLPTIETEVSDADFII